MKCGLEGLSYLQPWLQPVAASSSLSIPAAFALDWIFLNSTPEREKVVTDRRSKWSSRPVGGDRTDGTALGECGSVYSGVVVFLIYLFIYFTSQAHSQ